MEAMRLRTMAGGRPLAVGLTNEQGQKETDWFPFRRKHFSQFLHVEEAAVGPLC